MIRKRKIIWGILAAISIGVFAFFMLPSRWFWVLWEIVSAGLVAVGCFGEWRLMADEKPKKADTEHHRRELRFVLMVAIGVTAELFGIGHAIFEGFKLENEVADAVLRTAKSEERTALTESNNLALRKDLTSLNKSVLELAHLYDMSTNALAEANKRLETIRPARNLSREQQISLFDVVKRLPQMKVSMMTDQGVPDGRTLIEKLVPVFQSAKWEIGELSGGIYAGIGDGVQVKGSKADGFAIKTISDAINSLGLRSFAVTNPPPQKPKTKISTNSIIIIIGYDRK